MMAQHTGDRGPDNPTGSADDISAQLRYTPRYLEVPSA
jgi:hypothetical protein